MGLLITRISKALTEIEKVEHIYLFVLGHNVPHLHFHLIPRYPNTPRKWWGIHLDEWPEAPRGGLKEVGLLCDRIRAHLFKNPL